MEAAQTGGSGVVGVIIGAVGMYWRFKKIEDGKVDVTACNASHEGLGHEIRDMKDAQKEFSTTQIETLKVVHKMSGFLEAKFNGGNKIE